MLQSFFKEEGIECYAALSAEHLPVSDQDKWKRMEEAIGTVQSAVIFLIPYYAGQKTTNLSVYAQTRDYHLYIKELTLRLKAHLSRLGETAPFQGFADTSPLDEREAALRCGLGFFGENGLLIHPEYGSFFFIGAFFFTRHVMPELLPVPRRGCPACGRCKKACPTLAILDEKREKCLSLISQKKERTPEEEALLAEAECKWGCDLCQNACPFNENPKETPIPFFQTEHISALTQEAISLPKKEFLKYAFSWRGRSILKRNLEGKKDPR